MYVPAYGKGTPHHGKFISSLGGRKVKLMRGIIAFCMLFLSCAGTALADPILHQQEEVVHFLTKLYEVRASHLIYGDDAVLNGLYADRKSGQVARNHEIDRAKYVRAWALKRNLDFVNASTSIRIVRMRETNGFIQASVIQSLKLSYIHHHPDATVQHCGLGTRHVVKLVKQDDGWRVASEWYSDPLEENPERIPVWRISEDEIDNDTPVVKKSSKLHYDRAKAVEYADKYAGAAWGAGNNSRYNRKYRDYTPLGGDCTNFASQVIGDAEEGGGLKMTSTWQYWKNAGGSHTWVQTDKLKNFLLFSGYGKVVAKGYYADVYYPRDKFPNGAFASLKPGDLIAYEMSGDIDHFAIFMGMDDHGYPLVNCHTADRFHVPFDLGWDNATRYWLIHIRD